MQEVLIKVENNVGFITLNRPQVINSLSLQMVTTIYEQLKQWQNDQSVALICIGGKGEKGFCAGGDMVSFYDVRNTDIEKHAEQFFTAEYSMDYLIHHYPKPVIAFMNGIVMGGGVGVSIGATNRIVTETTKWAMPEMNIGFFPDVAGSYFLSRMPGCVGTYLALTGEVIRSEDVLYIDAADYYLTENDWGKLRNDLLNERWEIEAIQTQVSKLIEKHQQVNEAPSQLANNQQKIDEHFNYETVGEIVQSLRSASERGDDWAKRTVETILLKSPISLKVALQQLQKGRNRSLKECFEMEFSLGMNFMSVDDFYEGVRAVLVDKDRNPAWNLSSVAEVKRADVEKMFEHRLSLFP